MTLSTLLIIILILILIGAVPSWPYSRAWGYGPSGIVGVILVLATVPIFAALLRIPFAIIGPMIVAICFNMDVGDGLEFADDPDYPEKFASQAIRLGTNYALYSLTH